MFSANRLQTCQLQTCFKAFFLSDDGGFFITASRQKVKSPWKGLSDWFISFKSLRGLLLSGLLTRMFPCLARVTKKRHVGVKNTVVLQLIRTSNLIGPLWVAALLFLGQVLLLILFVFLYNQSCEVFESCKVAQKIIMLSHDVWPQKKLSGKQKNLIYYGQACF